MIFTVVTWASVSAQPQENTLFHRNLLKHPSFSHTSLEAPAARCSLLVVTEPFTLKSLIGARHSPQRVLTSCQHLSEGFEAGGGQRLICSITVNGGIDWSCATPCQPRYNPLQTSAYPAAPVQLMEQDVINTAGIFYCLPRAGQVIQG